MKVAEDYNQARRDVAAEAAALVRTILAVPPSAVRKAGIRRAVEGIGVAL